MNRSSVLRITLESGLRSILKNMIDQGIDVIQERISREVIPIMELICRLKWVEREQIPDNEMNELFYTWLKEVGKEM